AYTTFFRSESRDVFDIGLIGSFHVKYKGHLEAIKALSLLKEKGYNNIRLNLVGTGATDWVEDLIRKFGVVDNVKIWGAIKSGEEGIFPFLDKVDLYIHPSKTEGLPRVILEAMSRGKMCLGSDVGGTNELLRKEFIHAAGDWRTLAKQMNYLIDLGVEDKIS